MSIENKLLKMKGKSYMYKLEVYKIIDFTITEHEIWISTDKKLLKMKNDEEVLKNFLEASDDEKSRDRNQGENPFALVVNEQEGRVVNLKSTVLNTIEKIQNDAGYIPQAKSILAGVQTFTNMLKVEVDIARLAGKHK